MKYIKETDKRKDKLTRIVSDDEKIELLNDYNNGMSIKKLQKKYHRDSRTIYKIFRFLLNIEPVFPKTPKKDLTGQVFGKLTVIEISHVDKWRAYHWWCQCDCGNPELFTVNNRDIQNGNIKSCGCLREIADTKRFKNILNQKFNKLTVIKKAGLQSYYDSKNRLRKNTLWECLCDCNNVNTIIVTTNALINGGVRSCGCLADFRRDKSPRWNPNLSQEEREIKRKTPEYKEWADQVKKRDNYTCQISGIKSGGFCSHHLEGWNWCVEKRYNLDNGITLSESVHILFHKSYGQGNNTQQQFLEFKQRYHSGEWLDYQI